MTPNFTRRGFLRTTALAGGALVVGCRVRRHADNGSGASAGEFSPNAWVRVDADGAVTVVVDDVEMGQGVMTGLPMLVAEELAVDWTAVRTEYGTEDPSAWPRPISTGGSSSMRTSWDPLRSAGAAAREMLVTAAAEEWEVDGSECRAEHGTVIHEPTGRRRTYGQLVDAAAAKPVPEDPPLRDPGGYRLVGARLRRLDSPAKVDGSHVYGMDVRVPGMRYAAIARSPVFGGSVGSYDDAAAREVPGVVHVVEVSNGVAVIAENTWAAQQGRDALEIEWDAGPNADLDDAGLWSDFTELAEGDAGGAAVADEEGDAPAAFRAAPAVRRVEATYRAPFLAHATMEPQNCTAHVTSERAEVWAPTQRLTAAQEVAAEAAGLPVDAVTMHAIPPGGGFGRRLANDYVREAVEVARAFGEPVKVVWTREDDTRHSVYRPAALHRMRGALAADGSPAAWDHRVVAPSIIEWSSPGAISEGGGLDGDAVAGADDLPYTIPDRRVDYVMAPRRVPVGWWRGVGYTHTVFAFESFIDEMADRAGDDPYAYRRRLLRDSPRHLGVLDAVADEAGWGGAVPAGRGRGLAVYMGFGSYVGMIVETSVERVGDGAGDAASDGDASASAGGVGAGDGPAVDGVGATVAAPDDGASGSADQTIRVHRVWCAIDCGRIVNPALVEAQIQSGVVFGLTAALYGKLTLEGGGFREGNFDAYRMLRMPDMPEVHPVLIESEEDPTGVGEPPVPPVAPALANAVYAATGRRLRDLPLMVGADAPVI